MYTPVMPAVGRRRQEVHEFEADQGCFQEKEDKKLYSVTCYLVFPFFIYFYLFFIFWCWGLNSGFTHAMQGLYLHTMFPACPWGFDKDAKAT
jgi:hypothetical protein